MKMVCDYDRRRITPEEILAMRGWRVYDDEFKDFASHERFYDGTIVPISKALEAEKLIAVLSKRY